MIGRVARAIERVLIASLAVAVRIYQATLSPLLGPTCRFEPTCSRYLVAAVRKHGLPLGLWRGAWRILRCHPWSPGGHDPP